MGQSHSVVYASLYSMHFVVVGKAVSGTIEEVYTVSDAKCRGVDMERGSEMFGSQYGE
jgi:hypothetical protein